MILGTAGHIDHGKTTLVRALTGVDTDRLPEEKRRGITIDLGFAPLECAWGTLGVVDVPGHEAFVRTMLAGATGIDLALLVIAADEGVMPQTREHLAILTLLGVRGGVVALTKSDMVDVEWIELVREDVRATIAGTPLAAARILFASGTTGRGIEELRGAICEAAAALPVRDADDLFRLPVDRAFTVRGTGTVATGTVWSGSVAQDAVVRILPGERTARVRGVQAHGSAVGTALPGTRAAISLHGVTVEDVSRGSVLVTHPAWRETRVLRADVALLEGRGAALGPRTRVRFHLGTHNVGARVVASGGPVEHAVQRAVRIVLDAPVVARAGDRFVLRGGNPLSTIGGGSVTDPSPDGRRVRPWPSRPGSAEGRLDLLLSESGAAGLDPGTLAVRMGLAPREVSALLDARAGVLVVVGGRVHRAALVGDLADRLVSLVAEHHVQHPLEPGAPLQAARASLGVSPALGEAAMRHAIDAHRLEQRGGVVARPDWKPTLTLEQAALSSRLLTTISGAQWEPPAVSELEAVHGAAVPPLLRFLEREGAVVQVEDGRYYARTVLDTLGAVLRAGMVPGTGYGPAELREVLGVSRKYLIPLLEYCDRVGLTDRQGAGRVLRGT